MQDILNIVLPVFGIILGGYLARHFNILDATSSAALNRFVYAITLPPLLFLSSAKTPLEELLNWPFIEVYLSGILITLALALLGGRFLFGHRDLATLTLHAMAAIFANTVYMGIPLFQAAFGREGTTPVIVAALISNLFFIGAAVIHLEWAQAQGDKRRKIVSQVLGALLRSPVVTPLLLGLLVSYLQLPLPQPVENFLDLMAGAAGPTALFALGLSLYGHSLQGDIGEISWLVFLKLLVNPLVTWGLAVYVFTLDPFWANSAVLIAAIPTGALVFVHAQRYNVYVQRSAAIVIATTSLSIITLAALLAWFGSHSVNT